MYLRSRLARSRSVVPRRGVVCRPALRRSRSGAPSPVPLSLLAAALVILLLACALAACAHTPAGLAREEAYYSVATNSLAQAQAVARSAPPPFNFAGEAVLGLLSAALGAWNISQHKRLNNLEQVTGCKNYAPPDPPSSSSQRIPVRSVAKLP
jgi:hypothetical protein